VWFCFHGKILEASGTLLVGFSELPGMGACTTQPSLGASIPVPDGIGHMATDKVRVENHPVLSSSICPNTEVLPGAVLASSRFFLGRGLFCCFFGSFFGSGVGK
jgi:hypothetical protein